jgi:hypothetical protein
VECDGGVVGGLDLGKEAWVDGLVEVSDALDPVRIEVGVDWLKRSIRPRKENSDSHLSGPEGF